MHHYRVVKKVLNLWGSQRSPRYEGAKKHSEMLMQITSIGFQNRISEWPLSITCSLLMDNRFDFRVLPLVQWIREFPHFKVEPDVQIVHNQNATQRCLFCDYLLRKARKHWGQGNFFIQMKLYYVNERGWCDITTSSWHGRVKSFRFSTYALCFPIRASNEYMESFSSPNETKWC